MKLHLPKTTGSNRHTKSQRTIKGVEAARLITTASGLQVVRPVLSRADDERRWKMHTQRWALQYWCARDLESAEVLAWLERVTCCASGDPSITQFHFRPLMQGTRDRAFSLKPWQPRIQLYSILDIIFVLCCSHLYIVQSQEMSIMGNDWYSVLAARSRSIHLLTGHTTDSYSQVHTSQTKHKIIGESYSNRDTRCRFKSHSLTAAEKRRPVNVSCKLKAKTDRKQECHHS